jgi:cellobiose phosphorylase
MLNRWNQDLVLDEMGRFLYLHERETGALWSADVKPTRAAVDRYEARYGLGYATTTLEANGVLSEKTVFVPNDAPCEIWVVRLTDLRGRPRRLDVTSWLEWHLGGAGEWHREFARTFIETEWLPDANAVFAWKRADISGGPEPPEGFVALLNLEAAGFDTDKETFVGSGGSVASPEGASAPVLAGRAGKWTDPIAAIRADVTLPPNGTAEVTLAIGSGDREVVRHVARRFREPGEVESALRAVKATWRDRVEAVRVETPDPALDLMTNAWLKYQAITGRLLARTGYYQNSGAYGFRDQLQDSQVWLPLEPERTREQILLHAAHQFADGTVQHWWHPDTEIAAVTDCSDDLLWLPFITLNYLDETDDAGVWDETAPYLDGGGGTLYEHCCRAIDRALARFSERGLPLIGDCDWNDGFSHLGRGWRGESAWLAHFLVPLLRRFAEHADERADATRAATYRQRADALVKAVNEHCWDGEWYWRATGDDGRVVGSHLSEENRIDLIAQSWAVIGGTAPEDRAKQAMSSARRYLFREYGPLLLTPAYTRPDSHIGYITRYAPGIRENGGVYTHAATWGLQALCMLGEGDAAWSAYAAMSPPRRGQDPGRYCAEPYVTPGNVDGPDSPTFGRGGWTWYTGSAAWLQKVALEWILGVRATRKGLLIDPCVPSSWREFRVKRRFRGAVYHITVRNPSGAQKGVLSVVVDGSPLDGRIITPGPGGDVAVDVTMG